MENLDQYDKEMIRFLTQRNNFENMVKVVDLKDIVHEKLVKEFWEIVLRNVIQKMQDFPNWKIPVHNSDNDSFASVNLNWEKEGDDYLFYITWFGLTSTQHAYIGININRNSEIWNINDIHSEIKYEISKSDGMRADKWWPYWKWATYNFSDFSQLVHILPDKREALAEQYAKDFIAIIEKHGEQLDQFYSQEKYKI